MTFLVYAYFWTETGPAKPSRKPHTYSSAPVQSVGCYFNNTRFPGVFRLVLPTLDGSAVLAGHMAFDFKIMPITAMLSYHGGAVSATLAGHRVYTRTQRKDRATIGPRGDSPMDDIISY